MAVVAAVVLAFAVPASGGPLPGAIFTTTVDGTIINANVQYEAKEDVYLDGGPGPNAPASAAGLPEGDYFFQVTDLSGKDLLSTDHISCRKVHVNAAGVIDFVYAGQNPVKVQGTWISPACQHAQGVDADHSELGAITVQLVPYDDTPNPGGVYKAWMTPVANFAGDTALPCQGERRSCNVNGEGWEPGNVHGFIPAWSKTDNYKVDKKGRPFDAPELTVLKFHDANMNGIQDEGEEDIAGWEITITDPSNVTNVLSTRVEVLTPEAGIYTVVEDLQAGTLQTVTQLDGSQVSIFPTANPTVLVTVEGVSEETHEVVYGNVGLGSVEACKVFDRNENGVVDEGEVGISGWRFELSGTDILDAVVGPISQDTGENGCTTFDGLLPGTYTVTEIIPATGGWSATGPTTSDPVVIESSLNGGVLAGTATSESFTNVCTETADFGTKGFWHNKNGLGLITQADVDYVNLLAPYSSPSSYFGAGDEPFDGFFADGTPVAASHGILGEELGPEGSTLSEISQFLVDSNAGADPREQLAQQLLAFIFNTRHFLDGPGAILPGGDSGQDLIDDAIAAWSGNDAGAQTAIKDILDALNNSDALPFIPTSPCAVAY